MECRNRTVGMHYSESVLSLSYRKRGEAAVEVLDCVAEVLGVAASVSFFH